MRTGVGTSKLPLFCLTGHIWWMVVTAFVRLVPLALHIFFHFPAVLFIFRENPMTDLQQ
jgi:hypothetical protein